MNLPKSWGGVARRGAARLGAGDRAHRGKGAALADGATATPPAPFEPQRWEEVAPLRAEAGRAATRARRPSPPAGTGSPPTGTGRRPPRTAGPGSAGERAERELEEAVGGARATRASAQLRDASRAFERERFAEARSLLKPLADQAPGSLAVRELLGLTYYRLGRWKDATRELEALAQRTSSTDQHPVLADCYRALKRWERVDQLWAELRSASPSAELMAEGRIVVAGSRADRGDLAGAIALLEEKARRPPRRVRAHHLRVAYALADLYERAGDISHARELFTWVSEHQADFADAARRARALR